MLAGVLMVTLAAASWGTWSLFLRPTNMSPMATSPLVFVIITVAAMPFALRGPRVVWTRRAITLILLNTAFDALNLITFFAAIDQTTVAVAVLSHYVAPILIALAAPRVDGTSARGTIPAAIVALGGLVVVLEPWGSPAHNAALGATLGVLSATCYAGNMFVVRRLAIEVGATKAMAYHSLVAALVLSPLIALHASEITAPGVGLLAAGAVSIGAISGVVFAVGVARIGSARAAVLTFAEPLVAVAVGVLVWDEPLRPLAFVGGALVIGAGLYVTHQSRAAGDRL